MANSITIPSGEKVVVLRVLGRIQVEHLDTSCKFDPWRVAQLTQLDLVSAISTRCHPAGQKLGHSEREHSNEPQPIRA